MSGRAATRVEIRDCAKTYAGGTRALFPTSLVVEPGEVVALLGPSGCGKTTLLRVVAGLVATDPGGSVRFNDDDVTARPIETRGVGMVFQHYALFPQMTVEGNIGYGLRVRGVSDGDRRRRVGELVELMRLGGLEQRRPAQLSGGQKQRVALARAVALEPRVLLLDEPLTALDAKLKVALREELADLLRRLSITAIHVTHDQEEAMAIADRLAVMRAGAIVQTGAAEALYRDPADPFVAEFLGRVNRIERTADDATAGIVRIGSTVLRCPPALAAHRELLVRPEDIAVQAAPAGDVEAATVVQRVFLGDRVHLRVQGSAGAPLLVDVASDAGHAAGDRLRLTVDPARLMRAAPQDG